MERWQKLNVYFSLIGFLVFIVSIIFVKKVPMFLFPAAFGLGITFKSFKNIYKKVEPPKDKSKKNPYDTRIQKNKKKKKK